MNKFAFGALAAPLLCATSMAADTEWPELDRELAALSNAPLTQDSGGPYLNGWLISSFDYNADAEDANSNKSDVGFNVNSARIQLEGSIAKTYGYKIGVEFFDTGELYAPSGTPVGANGAAGIADAYGTFAIGEYVDFKMGIFRGPTLRSSGIDRNHTLFIERSFLGQQLSSRDAGLEIGGSFDRFHWALVAQNGMDGKTDGFAWGVDIDIDLMGEMSGNEGAYGAAEGTNLNLGLIYMDDTSDTAAGASQKVAKLGGDVTLVTGPFSLFGEVIDYDTDTGPSIGGMPIGVNNTPWSAGLGYLVGEEYEIAFRYDSLDVSDQTSPYYDGTRYNFVLNRYIQGHDIKWQLQFGFGDSKASGTTSDKVAEHTIIAIALALGF